MAGDFDFGLNPVNVLDSVIERTLLFFFLLLVGILTHSQSTVIFLEIKVLRDRGRGSQIQVKWSKYSDILSVYSDLKATEENNSHIKQIKVL